MLPLVCLWSHNSATFCVSVVTQPCYLWCVCGHTTVLPFVCLWSHNNNLCGHTRGSLLCICSHTTHNPWFICGHTAGLPLVYLPSKPFYFQKPFLQSHCPEVQVCISVCLCMCSCMRASVHACMHMWVCCMHWILKACTFKQYVSA